jgi:hypothetical protein
MTKHVGISRLVSLVFVFAALSSAAFADSHVRIVRLSSVEGQVQMDRANQGLEKAILNTPVVEGTRIATGDDGLAEVEFENQSALRLTSNSEVKFTQLVMNDAGVKVNHILVDKGMVYLDTTKGDDTYLVTVGDRTVSVDHNTLMRLSATSDKMQVAVFKGEVQLQGEAQPVIAHKKDTLTVDLNNATQYALAKGIDEDRYDKWNSERQDYSKTYADNQGYGGPNRGYGMQDLNYYGDFFYANGYGYVWQPFGFAGSMMNWNPYMNGAWMFYPGMGYTFASSYPWGWLPFHYGSWAYLNNAGWAWVPGRYNGQWYTNNFQVNPYIAKGPAGWTTPVPPANTITPTIPRTVVVGKGATPVAIPGGRIPPSFGSVVPGRAAVPASAHGFAKPMPATAGNHQVFAAPNATNHGANGHVFAPPVARGGVGMEPVGRVGSVGGPGVSAGSVHGGAPMGSVHSGGTSAATAHASAGGGGAHK